MKNPAFSILILAGLTLYLPFFAEGQGTENRSIDQTGGPLFVTFANQTGSSVTAYWVDFKGLNQQLGFLLPNQTVQVITYPGHLTLFTANGKTVAQFRAKAFGNPAFAIVGPGGQAANPIPKPSFQPTVISQPQGGAFSKPVASNARPGPVNLADLLQSLSATVLNSNRPGQNSNPSLADVLAGQSGGAQSVKDSAGAPSTGPKSFPKTISSNLSNFRQDPELNRAIDLNRPDILSIQIAVAHVTNETRGRFGKSALKISPELSNASNMHAQDMLRDNFFSHDNPGDSTKRTMLQRAALHGITNKQLGENIIQRYAVRYGGGSVYSTSTIPPHSPVSLADDLVASWMNSPGHRANILNNSFSGIGCGVEIDRAASGQLIPRAWGVQMFEN